MLSQKNIFLVYLASNYIRGICSNPTKLDKRIIYIEKQTLLSLKKVRLDERLGYFEDDIDLKPFDVSQIKSLVIDNCE